MSAIVLQEQALGLTLNELAASIREEHECCVAAYRKGLEHARRCGQYLLEAKQQVGHKQWLRWQEEHTGIKQRTAQVYMQLAREWHLIEASGATDDLTINEALALLKPEPVILQAELVEAEPIPAAPAKRTAHDYRPGDRAIVVDEDNLYHGQTVEIVEKRGKAYVGKGEDGAGYLFMPLELEPIETDAQQKPEQPKPLSTKQLLALLERCYQEAGGIFSSELRAELEAVLDLA